MIRFREKRKILPPAVAGALTLLVYLPSLQNGFVNWDDPAYVTEAVEIRKLSPDFFIWALGAFKNGNWHPLTIISYAVEYRISGLNPFSFHLTNAVLHCICVFILSMLFSKMLGILGHPDEAVPVASFSAALLFGAHPLHVESVSWISERKDLLCGIFYFLSLLFYLEHKTSRTGKMHYALCLSSFVLALTAKPMAVTLPLVLVAADVAFLAKKSPGEKASPVPFSWAEKAPFFILSAAAAAVSFLAQKSEGALGAITIYPPGVRILNACAAYLFYVWKLLLPISLSPFYPYKTDMSPFSAEVLFSAAAACAICVFSLLRWRSGDRKWAGLLFFYFITLLPVIGIVQIGEQSAADRYAYIPTSLLFLPAGIMASGVCLSDRRMDHRKTVSAVCLLLTAIALSAATVRQQQTWRNSETLWSRAVEIYPDRSHLPYLGRGMAKLDVGNFGEAYSDCEKASFIKPDDSKTLHCMAEALFQKKDYEGAVRIYDRIIGMAPSDVSALHNRGSALTAEGRYQPAERDFRTLMTLQPDSPEPYYDLAAVFALQHDEESACLLMRKSFELGFADIRRLENDPDFASFDTASCMSKMDAEKRILRAR